MDLNVLFDIGSSLIELKRTVELSTECYSSLVYRAVSSISKSVEKSDQE